MFYNSIYIQFLLNDGFNFKLFKTCKCCVFHKRESRRTAHVAISLWWSVYQLLRCLIRTIILFHPIALQVCIWSLIFFLTDEVNKKKSKKTEEEYSLITITVNNESVKKGLKLKCLDDNHVLTGMNILITWYEVTFKSRVNLHSNENAVVISLDVGFTRKVISCEVTLKKKSLYTREHLLSEHAKQIVEAFVTDEISRGTRGGRLVHENPLVIYVDGFKPMFLSVHLMNIGNSTFSYIFFHRILRTV